jgi:hypothetical protein
MNAKKYKEDDILLAYVLNLLPPAEQQLLDEKRAADPVFCEEVLLMELAYGPSEDDLLPPPEVFLAIQRHIKEEQAPKRLIPVERALDAKGVVFDICKVVGAAGAGITILFYLLKTFQL